MLNRMGAELVNMPFGWFLKLFVAYLVLFYEYCILLPNL